jgi:hypothetical protein
MLPVSCQVGRLALVGGVGEVPDSQAEPRRPMALATVAVVVILVFLAAQVTKASALSTRASA